MSELQAPIPIPGHVRPERRLAVHGRADDAGKKGFGLEEIDTLLRKGGIVLQPSSIDEACNILSLAGILKRKGREYYFTSPVFTRVINQTYDLDYLFRKVVEEGYDRV